jgi:hypothetical protein
MAHTSLVRGVTVSGALLVALAGGAGIASAAPYGGVATGGVIVSGNGASTFTGGGYAPGTGVVVSVSSCGTTKTYNAVADSSGAVSVPVTSAGETSYAATGVDADGLPLTNTSSALVTDSCPGGAVLTDTGAVGGNGGGGLPFTGFEVGAAAAIGLAAIGAGSVVVMASRRRRRGEAAA